MSRGKRLYERSIGSRLSKIDDERFEQFRKEKNLTNSEAARILLKLALDIVLSGKQVKRNES